MAESYNAMAGKEQNVVDHPERQMPVGINGAYATNFSNPITSDPITIEGKASNGQLF